MTTLNLQVGASEDDGVWVDGKSIWANNATAESLGGNWNGGTLRNFYRFTAVSVPSSSVSSAVITLRATRNDTVTPCIVALSAIAEDSASAPSSYSDAISRTLTSSASSWTLGSWSSGSDYTSTDLATAIQEVIDRAGWASGNAIVVVASDNGSSSSATRTWRTYDGSSTLAPKLAITYTAGGGGTTVKTLAATGVGG